MGSGRPRRHKIAGRRGSAGQGVAAVGQRVDQAVGDQAVQRALPLHAARPRPGPAPACGTGPAAARSTSSSRPRTWRSVPVKRCGRARGPGVRGGAGAQPGALPASGHSGQRGRAGRADQRAQLHQRDAEARGARPARRAAASATAARSRAVAGGPGSPCPSDAAGHDPAHVRVDHRHPLPERERRDGPRGVRADAGQRRAAPRRRAGTSPPKSSRMRHRAGVQAQRPARVAELAPHPHRLARRGGGQRGRRRPALEPRGVHGPHPATGVCCSMISLTSTAQGPASGRRHGRSRAAAPYHSSTGPARSATAGGRGISGIVARGRRASARPAQVQTLAWPRHVSSRWLAAPVGVLAPPAHPVRLRRAAGRADRADRERDDSGTNGSANAGGVVAVRRARRRSPRTSHGPDDARDDARASSSTRPATSSARVHLRTRPPAPCVTSSLQLKAVAGKSTYHVGDKPMLQLQVTNTGTRRACRTSPTGRSSCASTTASPGCGAATTARSSPGTTDAHADPAGARCGCRSSGPG